MTDFYTRNIRKAAVAGVVAGTVIGSAIIFAAESAAHVPFTPRCSPNLVLALDGTKGPTTPTSIDPESPLNPITDEYRTHPDYVVEHIAYPGSIYPDVFGWTMSYDESVEKGKAALRERISTQESLCGSTTQYVLIGYSQGARVVGDVVSEIDADRVSDDGTDLQDRIRAELYSDPRSTGTGIEVVLAGQNVVDGVTFMGERPEIVNIPVAWICNPGDGVCDAENPVNMNTLIGYLMYHTNY